MKSYGARNLDPRCRSSFYAIVHHADGPDERITSTGGRSGGALQELTSFVYGAALIYLLGGGLTEAVLRRRSTGHAPRKQRKGDPEPSE